MQQNILNNDDEPEEIFPDPNDPVMDKIKCKKCGDHIIKMFADEHIC